MRRNHSRIQSPPDETKVASSPPPPWIFCIRKQSTLHVLLFDRWSCSTRNEKIPSTLPTVSTTNHPSSPNPGNSAQLHLMSSWIGETWHSEKGKLDNPPISDWIFGTWCAKKQKTVFPSSLLFNPSIRLGRATWRTNSNHIRQISRVWHAPTVCDVRTSPHFGGDKITVLGGYFSRPLDRLQFQIMTFDVRKAVTVEYQHFDGGGLIEHVGPHHT